RRRHEALRPAEHGWCGHGGAARAHVGATGSKGDDARPASERPRDVCRPLHRVADARPERGAAGEHRPEAAGPALPLVLLPSGSLMRVAFDVSPLSHPRTGIGNYILGSLSGLAAAAGSEHEIVAFAPTSLR